MTYQFDEEVKQSIGSDAGSTLDFCGGEWKYPRTCSTEEKTCEYFARWEFDETKDSINFTIQSIHTDKWTGIGFSDTPQMVNDLYVLFLNCKITQITFTKTKIIRLGVFKIYPISETQANTVPPIAFWKVYNK